MDNGKLHVEIGMDGKKTVSALSGSANPEHILCRVLPAGNRRGIQENHALLREPGGQPGMDEGVDRMRTNLAERLGYEPEETTEERRERLREELEARKAARRIVKGMCLWVSGAAMILSAMAGTAEMTYECVVTGFVALVTLLYGLA